MRVAALCATSDENVSRERPAHTANAANPSPPNGEETPKAIEKASLRPILPPSVIHRKQRGFATPIAEWLRTSMKSFAREMLLAQDARIAPLFNRSAVEALLRRHEAGAFDGLLAENSVNRHHAADQDQ